MDRLSSVQSIALQHIEGAASERSAVALDSIAGIFEREAYAVEHYFDAIEIMRAHARIVLHFHPDRFGHGTMNVAESLLREGAYRNQFETGLSSASPTAYPGGERDEWERALFGGDYHTAGVLASERPKYGALELIRFSDGPTPRFGSCYFVLQGVMGRTSLTFMGSEDRRAVDSLGTITQPHSMMAALLTEIENGGMASPPWPPFQAPTLGVQNLTVRRLCGLLHDLRKGRKEPSESELGRVLDTAIEAQVHGPIELDRDVERLVADPAFADTLVGETLRELAGKYGFPLQWHRGFRLPVREVPEDFRGPAVPLLAARIDCPDGILDAAAIGRAAASFHREPERWRDLGNHTQLLQYLRQIWHVLVHYGRPGS
jgi:hypothetical protein